MSISNELLTVGLACLVLTACESPAKCPAGTTKRGTSCIAHDAVDAVDAGSDAASVADAAGGDADTTDACPAGTLVYADDDEDGVGAGEAIAGCPMPGLAPRDGDCQPNNSDAFPGADELCNGKDEDCDDEVDEGLLIRLYVDADADGHGDAKDPGEPVCTGEMREGKVSSNDDCDDTCKGCQPDNANEAMCDGLDDNCNGEIDEGLQLDFKLDCDGDGHVSVTPAAQAACSAPALPTACAKGAWLIDAPATIDCDDANAKRSPSLTETCDGIDNDCDSSADDGLATKTYYPDCDNDQYPRAVSSQTRCGTAALVAPICDRYIVARSDSKVDCGDDDPRAHPGAAAVADKDGIKGTITGNRQDFNCDGSVTMLPTLSACPSGGCLAELACRVGTLSCGREGETKQNKTFSDPMGHPIVLCSSTDVTPTCR